MLRICASLFLSGLILGYGPCLLSCGPILISFIAGRGKGPFVSFISWLVFSFARVIVYVFLSAVASIAGTALFSIFYWERAGYIVWFFGALFIIGLALLLFVGEGKGLCSFLHKHFVDNNIKSFFILGLLIGFFPCVPLIGILMYITMISTNINQGIIFGSAFSLGTALSPLLILSVLAGSISKIKLFSFQKYTLLFSRICSLILFGLGSHILIKSIAGFLTKL